MKRAQNILSLFDLEFLRVLNNSKGGYSQTELKDKLKVNPLSINRHTARLEELKLINKERIDKTHKHKITISQKGKELLKIFDKIIKD